MVSSDITYNVTFIDALYHIALNQNPNAVFIWSVDVRMCALFY